MTGRSCWSNEGEETRLDIRWEAVTVKGLTSHSTCHNHFGDSITTWIRNAIKCEQYTYYRLVFTPQRRWQKPAGHRAHASTCRYRRTCLVKTAAHDNLNNCTHHQLRTCNAAAGNSQYINLVTKCCMHLHTFCIHFSGFSQCCISLYTSTCT